MTVTEKPWGREILVDVNAHYALKDIHMRAGTRSSLQSHRFKTETLLVISGKVSLTSQVPGEAERERVFGPGESWSLAPGTLHRVTVLEDARLIEASTPELDDVIRHSDDFGRVTGAAP